MTKWWSGATAWRSPPAVMATMRSAPPSGASSPARRHRREGPRSSPRARSSTPSPAAARNDDIFVMAGDGSVKGGRWRRRVRDCAATASSALTTSTLGDLQRRGPRQRRQRHHPRAGATAGQTPPATPPTRASTRRLRRLRRRLRGPRTPSGQFERVLSGPAPRPAAYSRATTSAPSRFTARARRSPRVGHRRRPQHQVRPDDQSSARRRTLASSTCARLCLARCPTLAPRRSPDHRPERCCSRSVVRRRPSASCRPGLRALGFTRLCVELTAGDGASSSRPHAKPVTCRQGGPLGVGIDDRVADRTLLESDAAGGVDDLSRPRTHRARRVATRLPRA